MALALRVLYLGVSSGAAAEVRSHFKVVDELTCKNKQELEAIIANGSYSKYHVIIAGPHFSNFQPAELAQSLRMTFQTAQIFYVSDAAEHFDRTELIKNGCTEAFLLPLDKVVMAKALAQSWIETEHKVYNEVKLVDIQPGTVLDFQISVYLKANNKYVVYNAKGDKLEGARLQRLRDHQITSVFVPADQLGEFYKYSATRMLELTSATGNLSDAERKAKLNSSVRELVTGMLSASYSRHFTQGKKVVDHTRSIVKELILLRKPGDWYSRMMSEVGQEGDGYSHSGSVATFAALFATILRIGTPEDMAIAGLMHDLGMSLLPAELQNKAPEKMTPEELVLYQQHPRLSLEAIQSRKLVISDSILKMIEQHHEKWDGTGFPAKTKHKLFRPEAQVLAIADRFDYLTRVVHSVSPMSPDQAIRQIEREGVADPTLVQELSMMFEMEQKAAG